MHNDSGLNSFDGSERRLSCERNVLRIVSSDLAVGMLGGHEGSFLHCGKEKLEER